MRRWPPIVWLGISIGSLAVLRGASGEWRPGLVIGGLVLMIGVLVTGVRWALRRSDGRPLHPAFYWAIGGTAAFYVLAAIAALAAGPAYAVAALAASIIPLAAVALIIATTRDKTTVEDGRLVDASAGAEDDPFPGIGLDQDTPAGESSELHDLDREDSPDRRFQPRAPREARRRQPR
jgi:hypothetical protein